MRFGRKLASVFLAGVPLAGILSAGAVHAQSVAPPNVVLILADDLGETTDLIREMPELFAEMLADYQVWEEANNVLPMPEGYNRGRAIFRYGFN